MAELYRWNGNYRTQQNERKESNFWILSVWSCFSPLVVYTPINKCCNRSWLIMNSIEQKRHPDCFSITFYACSNRTLFSCSPPQRIIVYTPTPLADGYLHSGGPAGRQDPIGHWEWGLKQSHSCTLNRYEPKSVNLKVLVFGRRL